MMKRQSEANVKPVIAAVCVALVSLPAASKPQPAPSLQAVALATTLVHASWGPEASGAADVKAAEDMITLTRAFYSWAGAGAAQAPSNPPVPPTDLQDARLHASLLAGAAGVAPKFTANLAQLYARTFNDAQLTALIAFYQSDGGKALIARNQSLVDRSIALQLKTAYGPPPIDAAARQQAAAMKVLADELHTPTPALKAFEATPAGQALKAKRSALDAGLQAETAARWPEAVAAAQIDYCGRLKCGQADVAFFTWLGGVFAKAAPH
jgi:hypothetical protein